MIKPYLHEYLVVVIVAIMTIGYYFDDGLASAMILGGFWSLVAMIFCIIYRDWKS